MGKKKTPAFMPVQKIRALAQMTDEDLKQALSVDEARRLIKSFQVADSVAYAGWRIMKELEAGNISIDAFHELRDALSEYSPDNFKPSPMAVAIARDLLEEVYNEASASAAPLEILFTAITKLGESID